MTLFRAEAIDETGETALRTWSGSWNNEGWKPIEPPPAAGIE